MTLLLTENSDLARMIVNSVRQDLTSFNDLHNCLALCAIANVGSGEMAEALYPDVYKLLISECVPRSRSMTNGAMAHEEGLASPGTPKVT